MSLPPELVDIIIRECWNLHLNTAERSTLMTSCPLVNHQWKAVYASISSEHIFVPTMLYLFYLSDIIRYNNSIIYDASTLRRASHISCFYEGHPSESIARYSARAKDAYTLLVCLPQYTGLHQCFPDVKYLNLQTICRGKAKQNSRKYIDLPSRLHISISDPSRIQVDWLIENSTHTKTSFFHLLQAMAPGNFISAFGDAHLGSCVVPIPDDEIPADDGGRDLWRFRTAHTPGVDDLHCVDLRFRRAYLAHQSKWSLGYWKGIRDTLYTCHWLNPYIVQVQHWKQWDHRNDRLRHYRDIEGSPLDELEDFYKPYVRKFDYPLLFYIFLLSAPASVALVMMLKRMIRWVPISLHYLLGVSCPYGCIRVQPRSSWRFGCLLFETVIDWPLYLIQLFYSVRAIPVGLWLWWRLVGAIPSTVPWTGAFARSKMELGHTKR